MPRPSALKCASCSMRCMSPVWTNWHKGTADRFATCLWKSIRTALSVVLNYRHVDLKRHRCDACSMAWRCRFLAARGVSRCIRWIWTRRGRGRVHFHTLHRWLCKTCMHSCFFIRAVFRRW